MEIYAENNSALWGVSYRDTLDEFGLVYLTGKTFNYYFEVKNSEKFMLESIKHGLVFETLETPDSMLDTFLKSR